MLWPDGLASVVHVQFALLPSLLPRGDCHKNMRSCPAITRYIMY